MGRILAFGVGLVALVAGLFWMQAEIKRDQERAYQAGYDAGVAAQAAEVERMAGEIERWRAAMLEQIERRRAAELERWREAQEVIDELRARPIQVRERIRTITIRPDDRCESLPPGFRRLWNAGAAPGAPAPGVPGTRVAAAGAALGDAATTRVAAAPR